jgi:hypothetical protein
MSYSPDFILHEAPQSLIGLQERKQLLRVVEGQRENRPRTRGVAVAGLAQTQVRDDLRDGAGGRLVGFATVARGRREWRVDEVLGGWYKQSSTTFSEGSRRRDVALMDWKWRVVVGVSGYGFFQCHVISTISRTLTSVPRQNGPERNSRNFGGVFIRHSVEYVMRLAFAVNIGFICITSANTASIILETIATNGQRRKKERWI